MPGDGATGPAAAVFAGLQARPSRQALEAVIEQLPPAQRQRHDAGLARAEQQLAKAATDGHLDRELRSMKRALFAAARETDNALFPRPVSEVSSATLCRYGIGLGEITVRDSVWLAIDQNRLDGRGLWLSLLQRLPSPYDSAPLFLFGWASWRDGNGTLAAMAAERALMSNPGYTAAELLLGAVRHGLDPRSTPQLRLPPRPGPRPRRR